LCGGGFAPRHLNRWARRGKIRQAFNQRSKIMRLKFCLSFLALLFFTLTVLSQTSKKSASVNLTNTTWQISFKESANESWIEGEKLTFLSGGKLKVDGETYPKTFWRLRGTKLSFSYSNDNAGMFGSGEVTVKGNRANGGGQLGMRGTPYIIRLTNLN